MGLHLAVETVARAFRARGVLHGRPEKGGNRDHRGTQRRRYTHPSQAPRFIVVFAVHGAAPAVPTPPVAVTSVRGVDGPATVRVPSQLPEIV